MPVERFVEQHIAEHIQCNICLGVPLSPVMTRCGHFHCKRCLNKWLDTADTCTACRRTLTMDDISEIHGFRENVHQVLHVYCKYKEQGCAHALLLRDLDAHESSCDEKDNQIIVQLHEPDTNEVNIADKTATTELAAPEPVVPEPAVPRPVRRHGPSRTKMPLSKVVDAQDCRTRRLKPFYDSFNKLCDDQYENKRDILFFMSRHELRKTGDLQTAKEIENLWKPERKTSLSVEQCLSLRVDTLMTKGQYRQQYGFF